MHETVIAKEIGSERFSFIAEEGETKKDFVAEASDLPGNYFHSRVWIDACDTGFLMVSKRTGNKVLFCLTEEKRDREGEVYAWEYLACVDFNYPLIAEDIKCVIFND